VAFKLVHAKFDERTRRAYVEFRGKDDDCGEVVVTTIFSFRAVSPLNHRQVEEEIISKARHFLREAATFGRSIMEIHPKQKAPDDNRG
jgi:hypothetical protein